MTAADTGAQRSIGDRRRAVFLDRDGTVIVEREYLSDPAGVALEHGAGNALRQLQDAGWLLVIVSNQSGIGRGRFGEHEVELVNRAVEAKLAAYGVTIHGIYFCPHAPDRQCSCRKPAPGLLLAAAAELNIDLDRSFMVGDKRSDLEAADRAGCTGILVTTGHGALDADWASTHGYLVTDGLAEAARFILGQK